MKLEGKSYTQTRYPFICQNKRNVFEHRQGVSMFLSPVALVLAVPSDSALGILITH